ncbi:sensor domain-containing diguanylate cyclase [Pararobbsia silviterrae]|nr:sensor domain-containing diguanylate cyclase [Pararobbsia silviterrae]
MGVLRGWRSGWRAIGQQRGKAVVAGALCLAIALLSVCAAVLLDSRDDAMQRAQTVSQNLSMVAERDIRRNLEVIDLSLKAMVAGAEDPETMALPARQRDAVMFDQALTAKYLGAVLILDESGNILLDSGHVPPRVQNYADRDYFQAQKTHPDLGLLISQPIASRLSHGASIIVGLSRRINHPDGSFAGIALITLSVNYFRDLLAGLDIGPHGAIALFEHDGTLLMRLPQLPSQAGPLTSIRGGANFSRFVNEASGAFLGRSSFDGERRLFVHTKIEPFGLTLVISPAERDIYASWRHRASILGGAMIVLAIGYLLFAELLASELRRRSEVETELRVLSRTDALTTVANRRGFDERLEIEWKRMKRDGTNLSVLFVDVDRFKQFNDRYGHERGDDVLRSVALAMKRELKRPSDLTARYGGEEFAMILPQTDRRGARVLAQQICDAVAALAIPNEASEGRVVTVSVGVATFESDRRRAKDARGASSLDSAGELLKAADAALYRAKHQGRNRVETDDAVELETVGEDHLA